MRSRIGVIFITVCVLVIFSITGCGTTRQTRYKSSVVEYLYPNKEIIEEPSVPRLALPLRVGVAFVPEEKQQWGVVSLGEREKMDLMNRIVSEFKALPFVKEIERIPSSYLSPKGGFTNLDQIKTMYGIDVIALLSYDQLQHTDEGLLSLTYWTLIGAYLIKGEKNDTSTMIDAAVYDIASRKMLFRAPGTSHVKGSATPINLSEQMRKDSQTGFQSASDDLVVNLKDQLKIFQDKVKEMPEAYIVEHKAGYTGGGSLGGNYAIILILLGALALWRSRKE